MEEHWKVLKGAHEGAGVVNTHHPQVTISHGETVAEVDAELAPLLLELWRAGWHRSRSCQDHTKSRMVWVGFTWPADVEAFLNVVAPFDPAPGSLWRRARWWGFGQYGRTAEPIAPGEDTTGAWEYHAAVTDGSYDDRAEERVAEAPDFQMEISILFPRGDLKTVTSRVRKWNEATE